jgi:hypothetical protein
LPLWIEFLAIQQSRATCSRWITSFANWYATTRAAVASVEIAIAILLPPFVMLKTTLAAASAFHRPTDRLIVDGCR